MGRRNKKFSSKRSKKTDASGNNDAKMSKRGARNPWGEWVYTNIYYETFYKVPIFINFLACTMVRF